MRRAATVAALALIGFLNGCGGPLAATPPHFRDGGTALDAPVPAAIDDITFTDETGRHVHLSDYAGKTVVLDDILTLCQEHCPIDTASMVSMARAYAASDRATSTVFLSITVDPGRDDPQQLAAYRRLYAGKPGE